MPEPYLAEIRLFPIGYTPKGWAPCEGQLLQINTNQALFALLGTAYGGNGTSTFALPNLRGRVPIHTSTSHFLGQAGGEENHTLTLNEIPAHSHQVSASANPPVAVAPAGNAWANQPNQFGSASSIVKMDISAISSAGNSAAHPNMQPFLALQFCIAITGIFPPRS
ncbi:phage tail protein [Paenibacillus puldeungensis]|uniref:Phage tail protein n=1 Tax=Paenibacillus puldeungensis TaxID=696536 RepID=A0ABW3RRZ5_9BACL